MGHDPPQQHGRVIDQAEPVGHVHEDQHGELYIETRQRAQHGGQPLPSPSISAHSGTPSNPTSSTSSSRAPRLMSDEGSSSSPSSAPFQTPENMSNLDPFSSLSITAIPDTDGLMPIVEDPAADQGALSTTPTTNPPSRPLPPRLHPLTSESLRPLNGSMGDARGSTVSTPSVASSGRSERRDQLAPLPSQRPTPVERPSLTRSQPSNIHTRPSPPPPKPNRIALPSPPVVAMGLSELMSGGSPLASPSNEQGYFAGVHSDSSGLTRSNSNSGSTRRTPHYSPFRSYYGPTAGQVTPDQLRRSDTRRASQSGPERTDRTESSKPGESSTQPLPPPHIRAATTTAVSLTAMAAEVTGSAARAGSDSSRAGSVGSGSTGPGRSPRVQNTGGVLAPHGSFTTARAPRKKKERAPKMAPASDSQLYVGNMRKMDLSEKALAAQAERDALEQAARSGDQLAMYRLGWVAELPRGQRYNIGSIEDVWGPSSPASSETYRSSFSSRGSITSFSSTGRDREPSTSRQGTPTSDLFADAAGLALRDTAGRSRSNSYFERPPSRQSSLAQMSPRP